MKILMFGWEFPPYNSGGLGPACYGLTKSLAKKGVSISFVLPKKMDIDVDFLKIICGEDSKTTAQYFVNSMLREYASVSYVDRIAVEKQDAKEKGQITIYGSNLYEEVERYGQIGANIARQENFDVIHAHDWLTYKAAVAAKQATGKYLVVHIHNTVFDRGAGNGNPYEYEIEKMGFESADKVIAISNYVKRVVVDKYGIPPEKVQVVHNGVEFENYALEQVSDLKKKNKIVLSLGRITIQKGIDYLVYAAKKVLEHHPNTIFVIAGGGDMDQFIIKKVAELGMADKFIFTGWLKGKDINAAYKMADLFVMPSVSEPFGLVPLESILSGTPALISKQSGVSEVLQNCLKVDFWDVDEMANKIVSVLKYDSLKKELLKNSFKEVEKMTWDTPAERCIDIYNELLRKGGNN